MKQLNLLIEGKEVKVPAMKMGGQIWFHYQGVTYEYAPKSSQSSAGATGALADPTKIISSMPGKIIKIFVSVGQEVNAGETVVAMEAMKMEYNLKASEKMKVKSINCTEGAQVSLSDVLVELEEL